MSRDLEISGESESCCQSTRGRENLVWLGSVEFGSVQLGSVWFGLVALDSMAAIESNRSNSHSQLAYDSSREAR